MRRPGGNILLGEYQNITPNQLTGYKELKKFFSTKGKGKDPADPNQSEATTKAEETRILPLFNSFADNMGQNKKKNGDKNKRSSHSIVNNK